MQINPTVDEPSTSKRALLAIQQLQAKLAALEAEKHEPIAIIGMGCRFPGGSNNPEAYWQMLRNSVDAMCEVPSDRWDTDLTIRDGDT